LDSHHFSRSLGPIAHTVTSDAPLRTQIPPSSHLQRNSLRHRLTIKILQRRQQQIAAEPGNQHTHLEYQPVDYPPVIAPTLMSTIQYLK
jgi:hypothetical protein